MNLMKTIKIEKITLNIGVGKPGPQLEGSMNLLKTITGCNPVKTYAKDRIPAWKLRPGLAIGAKVTLRGKKAEEVFKRLLEAVDMFISEKKFDNEGNFSFGIHEYIEIPEMKYDMDIGIIGLEVAVTLKRTGFRIKRRTIKKKVLPRRHRISKEDAIKFMKEKFNIQVKEEVEE